MWPFFIAIFRNRLKIKKEANNTKKE